MPNLLAVALVRVVAFARLLQPLRGPGESGRGEHMVLEQRVEGVAVATSIAEAFSSKLRSFQAPWETNSVFKRARNLWIRGLGSSLRQAAATVQAAALSVK